MINDGVEFETKEPTCRRFTPCRQSIEDRVTINAPVIAHGQGRGIHNRNAGAGPFKSVKQSRQSHGTTGQKLYATRIRGQRGKGVAQKASRIGQVKQLELPVAGLMEKYRKVHQLRARE